MATIKINRGLRKVDFHSADGKRGGNSHASIEFARETPLPPGEPIHIPLGIRDERVRALIGVPQLLGEEGAESSPHHEYLYRIGGLISEFAPEQHLDHAGRGRGPSSSEDGRTGIT